MSTVCVTGANGYIASYVVEYLLAKGHNVRGTVRNPDNAKRHEHLLSLEGADERLTIYKASLLNEGDYDRAVDGCDYVIHTASPYVLNVKDPQRDLVDPAVEGVVNVFKSCRKAGIRKVVLTSSVAAITDSPRNGYKYTEEDWNSESGLNRNPYYFSKTLAEKKAWALAEEFDINLVVINPFVVIGPTMTQTINPSNVTIQNMLNGQWPGILNLSLGLVDVRDVAQAHVLAMENDNAKGRYIVWNETKGFGEICDIIRQAYPQYPVPVKDMTGGLANTIVYYGSYLQPAGVGQYVRTNLGRVPLLDHSKVENELGLKFMDTKQSILDTCNDLLEKGHVPAADSIRRPSKLPMIAVGLFLLSAPVFAWLYYFR